MSAGVGALGAVLNRHFLHYLSMIGLATYISTCLLTYLACCFPSFGRGAAHRRASVSPPAMKS